MTGSFKVKNRYDEIFEVEIDGWCYGIMHFPGEIHSALIHRVIQELSSAFREAVENRYVFNLLDLAVRLSRASKYLVPEKEIAFAILYQLPNPSQFDEEGQFIVAQLVDQVEQAYGNAIERIQKKWAWENAKKREAA